MKRILSIDFDYFIDTDINTRNEKFPDGSDNHLTDDAIQDMWFYFYNKHPEIHNIGVTESFFNIQYFLSKLEKGRVLVAESHADIIKVLVDTDILKEELEVINIDFHHDTYITGGNNFDCANWVRHLMTSKPDTNFTWVKREDSEVYSLEGVFPYKSTEDYINTITKEYDYIFLCFSPEWTPPHLRPYFKELCRAVDHLPKF